MSPFLWIVQAVLLGLLAAGVVVYWAGRGRREPLPRDLPTTPLQRRARWAAALGGIGLAALTVILVSLGPERALADDRWRHGIELLAVGVLAVVAIAVGGVTLRGGGPTMDERDRTILERAPRAQVAAVLVTLMAWVIYLTERFSASGQVPVVFLSLIAWSCLLVAMLALPVGILVGYGRS